MSEQGAATSKGRVYFTVRDERAVIETGRPQARILGIVSGLLRFYPLVLRAGLILQRLVQ